MKICRLLLLGILAVSLVHAQLPDNSSLVGQYFFVHLLISVSPAGSTTNARNLGGTMTFDGLGAYSYTGRLGSGSGEPTADAGGGAYSVGENAFVTLTNPIVASLEINGRLGENNEILLGSSTEADDDSYDLFVAVKAPLTAISNFTLNGNYSGATLAFPNGGDDGLTTALLLLEPNGGGLFTFANARGHAADQGDVNVEQAVTNATYSLNADGSGIADFAASSSLISGDHDVFVSATGNYLIGFSTEAGGREIFLVIRNFSDEAERSDWKDDYWWAEMIVDPGFGDFSAASGALFSDGVDTTTVAERFRTNFAPLDFSGIFFYDINLDSTGRLAGNPGLINMAIGGPSSGQAKAFVGAQIGRLGQITEVHGIFFGVRRPQLSAPGVFVNPLGVVNSASFALATFPISGGALLSVFGTGMAPAGTDVSAPAGVTPLPLSLGGVSAQIDGLPTPLLRVRPDLIQLQVPFATSGTSLVVNNDGTESNEVELPVAATSPGIFSVSQNGLGPGIVTFPDFRLVTAQDPAAPGDIVVVWTTGLGAVSPPLADGAGGNTMEPFNRVTDPSVSVLFGGDRIAGDILFQGAAPGLVGVYQINVEVPVGIGAGPNVPLAIATSNGFSDFVDIAIGF